MADVPPDARKQARTSLPEAQRLLSWAHWGSRNCWPPHFGLKTDSAPSHCRRSPRRHVGRGRVGADIARRVRPARWASARLHCRIEVPGLGEPPGLGVAPGLGGGAAPGEVPVPGEVPGLAVVLDLGAAARCVGRRHCDPIGPDLQAGAGWIHCDCLEDSHRADGRRGAGRGGRHAERRDFDRDHRDRGFCRGRRRCDSDHAGRRDAAGGRVAVATARRPPWPRHVPPDRQTASAKI
jgi:hypothetical protein